MRRARMAEDKQASWRTSQWDGGKVRDDFCKVTKEQRDTSAYERGLVEAGATAMLGCLLNRTSTLQTEKGTTLRLSKKGSGVLAVKTKEDGLLIFVPEVK
jgi:hypothetical protein